ncbi:MAG TPA: hypothetical protein VNA89_09795 [Gemmatimonadaceae bacterium]|nr:hypothetical protein [Gemmatimonadaceae bacterium]
MPMHRRLFLRLAALLSAATLTGVLARPTGAHVADSGDDLRALAHPDLLDMLGAEQVRAIGARYREMVPSEGEPPALHAALRGRRPRLGGLLAAPRIAPAKQVRRDFAEGHTVDVDGWILSVTEARQCALYSLVAA